MTECRRCHEPLTPGMSIDGLCYKCIATDSSVLAAPSSTAAPTSAPQPSEALQTFGAILLVLGLLGVAYGLMMRIDNGGYANLGLMNDRLAVLIASGIVATVGAILVSVSRSR